MSAPYLTCAVITFLSAVISLGYALAALRGRGGQARTLARYSCVRSAALALVCGVSFFFGSTAWLMASATAMSLVQAGDAVVGLTLKDRLKILGPASAATANLLALLWLTSSGT